MKRKFTTKKGIVAVAYCIAALLFWGTNPTQSHAQYSTVTNTTGTANVGGRNVTVTKSGYDSSISECGATLYWEGIAYTTSSYTFSFDSAVSHIKLTIAGLSSGQKVAIKINGSTYTLTSANNSGVPTTCTGTQNACTISGGMLVGGTYSSAAIIDIAQCGITSVVINTAGTAELYGFVFAFQFNTQPVISGASAVCAGSTTTLTSSVTGSGGTWSSSNTSVATVNSSGVVSGVSGGSATITYAVALNGCSPSYATSAVTVNPAPNAGAISGPSSVCTGGATISLSESATGGSWTSTNTSVASINSSGVVSGLSAGSTTISYTVTNSCGTAAATKSVSVNTAIAGNIIKGTRKLCAGIDSTLSDTASGGNWSSSDTTIAKINSSGIVAGIAAGNAIISYSRTGTCGTATDTFAIAIVAAPVSTTISGTSLICKNATPTYTAGVTGGVWSINDTNVAIIDTTGMVTGKLKDTTSIKYALTNSCGTSIAHYNISVDSLPYPGSITGSVPSCVAGISSLADSVTGGTWSSTAPSVVSVSSTGGISATDAGTATISYTKTNGCGSTAATLNVLITANPVAGAISATSDSICAGSILSYSGAAGGGTWSSSNPTVASVDSSGNATGLTHGSAYISYTVTNICGTAYSIASIFVNDTTPPTGGITGATIVGMGSTTTLSYAIGGGIWSSSDTSLATVDATGVVSGIDSGMVIISYTLAGSTSCVATSVLTDTLSVIFEVGIPLLPHLSYLTLSDTETTGSYVSSYDHYSSNVTFYGCDAGSIYYYSGEYHISDPNIHLRLTDSVSGGTWSCSDASIATIDASGYISYFNPLGGYCIFTYSKSNRYGTSTVADTINLTIFYGDIGAGYISGADTICEGTTTTMTESLPAYYASSGGWSSTGGLSVSTSGVVTTLTGASFDTIFYTTVNSCSGVRTTTSHPLYVRPLLRLGDSIYSSICPGMTTLLRDTVRYDSALVYLFSGYTLYKGTYIYSPPFYTSYWASSDPSIATVDATSGIITTITGGNVIIQHTVSNACGSDSSLQIVTVYPIQDTIRFSAISGFDTICVGTPDTLSDTATRGVWSSSTDTIATVDTLGIVHGVHEGTVTITYTKSYDYGCRPDVYVTKTITVGTVPVLSAFVSHGPSCVGGALNITWSDVTDAGGLGTTTPYYSYYSGGSYITDDSLTYYSRTITIIASASNACGSATQGIDVPVYPSDPGTITGPGSVCPGDSVALIDSISGGKWRTTDTYHATIDSVSGWVHGISAGTAEVLYVVTNVCGVNDTAFYSVVSTAAPHAGIISGPDTLCVGSNYTLSSTISGGSWTSAATGIATIDEVTGVITGNGPGSTIISYIKGNGCGAFDTAQYIVHVFPVLRASSISGRSALCIGDTVTFGDSTSPGVWTTTGHGEVTIDYYSGLLHAYSFGSDTVFYTVANVCGSNTAALAVFVNGVPTPPAITGPDTVCQGAGITLIDSTSTYYTSYWSTGNVSVATVSYTGTVYGAGAGRVIISYHTTNECGSGSATYQVYVRPSLSLSPLAGTYLVCPGASIIFQDSIVTSSDSSDFYTLATDVWTSSNTSIATASNDPTYTPYSYYPGWYDHFGSVTGVSGGTVTIAHIVANQCGADTSSASVTVYPIPATYSGTISGTDTICASVPDTLNFGVSGGTWSSSIDSIATVSVSGIVHGLREGTTTISYTLSYEYGCKPDTSFTRIITVRTTPVLSAFSATGPYCVGLPVYFYSGGVTDWGGSFATGLTGIWDYSSDTSILAGLGDTALHSGYVTIFRSATNTCGTSEISATVFVNPSDPGTITGTNTICNGDSSLLTDGVSGGKWASHDSTIAAIHNSLYGWVFAEGSDSTSIYYIVENACGIYDTAEYTVFVPPFPAAGVISGPDSICNGATATLSESVTGGSWTSNDPSIVSVNAASGVITGTSAGTTTVTYTNGNGCGVYVTTVHTIKVLPILHASVISAPYSVCAGDTVRVGDSVSGGNWNIVSGTGYATLSGNLLHAYSYGTENIEYILSNMCGSDTATASIFINTLPVLTPITGADTFLCQGSSMILSDAHSFYYDTTWSTGNAAVATVSGTTVYGVAAGKTIVAASATNECGTTTRTYPIYVRPIPVLTVTAYDTNLCQGASVVLSNTTNLTDSNNSYLYTDTTDLWTLSNANLNVSYYTNYAWHYDTSTHFASINATQAGFDTVSMIEYDTVYHIISNQCGSDTATMYMIIHPLPVISDISGSVSICNSSTETLTDATSGGTWSSSNPYILTVNSSGVVTGSDTGSATIYYSVTNSCATKFKTIGITVRPLPYAGTIAGATSVCAGSTLSLADLAPGGTWSSSAVTCATITGLGVVNGVTAGSAIISYTVTNSCGTAFATSSITVNPLPNAGVISGASSVCTGATISLTDTASGGAWSSSAPSIASVNSSGTVTGIAAGFATIYYTFTNVCGTAIANQVIDVNPYAGTISGPSNICKGTTVTLTESVSGGTWTSSTTSVATVTSGGVVSGVAVGVDTIKYTVTNSCGTAVSRYVVTVVPNALSAITGGTSAICPGATTTLGESVTGGGWSSSNTARATVNASTGVVYAVASGSDTIIYTLVNACGTLTAIKSITVTSPTVPGGIAGSGAALCPGATLSFTDGTTGGTWSSSNTSVATVSSSGVVTAVGPGVDSVKYSITNGCGLVGSALKIVTVYSATAGTITGASGVCIGSNTTLADASYGGVWSSTSTSVATVSASGVVYGVSAGSTTIKYTITSSCGTTVASLAFNVSTPGSIGAISGGTTSICPGSTSTLSDATTGGTWSSSNMARATVNASTGIVTGVSPGIDTITYSVSNSCGSASTTKSVTITAPTIPVAISGSSSGICAGATTTFSDGTSGGVWSSSNTSIATVAMSGVVTAVAAGLDTIIYSYTNSCGQVGTAIKTVTINSVAAGLISGSSSLCAGSSITLTDTTSGGVWSSSNLGVATINSSGVLFGIGAGATVISYSVTNSCGTARATLTITVNPVPNAGAISGTTSLCTGGATSALTSSGSAGGSWASTNNAIAAVSSAGLVTSGSPGTDTITYSVTNSCGTASAASVITVAPLSNAGSISGASSICTGSTTTLSETVSGGAWSSTSMAIATISSSGLVTAVSAGTTNISYTYTNICGTTYATFAITVVAPSAVAAISGGGSSICPSATTTLTDATTGSSYSWSSSNSSVATINSSTGVVTGVAPGTDTIIYTVTTACGTFSVNKSISVSGATIPGAIAGSSGAICPGSTTTFSDGTSGGSWSATNTSVATVSSSGVVTGVVGGTDTILYSITNACGLVGSASKIVIVNPAVVSSITGPNNVCTGSSITLSDATAGGVWSSTSTSVATVSSGGVVYGNAGGNTTIKYTLTSSCGTIFASYSVTVSAPGVIAPITGGSSTLCPGATMTLADATAGSSYSWSSSNTAKATVDAVTGVVTGVFGGADTIKYTVTNACGTVSAIKAFSVIGTTVPGGISGSNSVHPGATISLGDGTSGGTWSSANTALATVSSSGVVTGVSGGTDTIKYSVTNSCGAVGSALKVITVFASRSDLNGGGLVTGTNDNNGNIALFPNPATSNLNIEWTGSTNGTATILITDILGKEVYNGMWDLAATSGKTTVDVSNLNGGIYIISISSENVHYGGRFVVDK